jgi:cysteine-rich repeat protein
MKTFRALAAAALLLTGTGVASAASPRIVNGVETTDYPTVGILLTTRYDAPVTQFNASLRCSGVLIGCRTFLTAAHCLIDYRPSEYAVYLQHAGFLAVESIHVDPDRAYDTAGHDLAILKLAEPVDGIVPSKVNATHDLEEVGVGLEGTIVGFGRIGGDFYDWEYENGLKRFGRIETTTCDTEVTGGVGDDKLVCWDLVEPIGAPGEDSSTCNGDSGGPMFMELGGSEIVVGITSGGTSDDCLAPTHTVDSNVFASAAWIAEQLEGDSTESCGPGATIGTPLSPVWSEMGTLGPAHKRRTLRVPLREDTSRVLVTFNAGDDGDFEADLFVKRNGDAGPTDFDCAARGDSQFGSCELENPGAGYLSVLLAAREYAGPYQLTVVESNDGPSVCGNATLEFGEDCDGASLGECLAGPCDPDCTCPAPVCGNDTLEAGEGCDDGNTVSGDGCDASCTAPTPDGCEDAPLALLAVPGTHAFHGDTRGLESDNFSCGSNAGDAWYRFSIDAPAVLSAETDGKFNSTLLLARGNCSEFFREQCDADDGVGPGSAIYGAELEPGEYILVVDGSSLAEGPFELSLSLSSPGCGNDTFDYSSGETCDGLDVGYCYYAECTDDCQCAEPVCGNDFHESGEDCDGADLGECEVGPCTPDCTCPEPSCGDGKQDWPEECDGQDGYCGPGSCTDDCTCERGVCGNDVRDYGESCDGSDLGSCSSAPCENCQCPDTYCGNGFHDSGESCDGDDLGYCKTGPCAGDCTCPPAVCGDGIRADYEQCDGDDHQYCIAGSCDDDCTCPNPVCGNGLHEYGEDCDGDSDFYCGSQGCLPSCECAPAVCGDGIRDYPEQCDGDAENNCQFGPCMGDCKCPAPICGNGVLETAEQCDSPDMGSCDRGPCGIDCKCPPPVCGNGILENQEDCDGEELGGCDAGPCGNDCTCPPPVCGNGILESGEECDGSSQWNCNSGECEEDCECAPPVCGDGEQEWPEYCDGEDLGYCQVGPCKNDCQCPAPVCGNDVTEGNEQCDGTNLGYCPAGPCDPDCTCPTPVCGNDIVEEGEVCDTTQVWSCQTGPCDPDCTCPAPVCGNKIVEAGEQCDSIRRGICLVGPCKNDCTCPDPVCGNLVYEPEDEECDGYRLGECGHGPCGQDCTCPAPACGDEYWDYPEEVCEPVVGENCNFGSCLDNCTCPIAVCGNGVREDDEDCDGDDHQYCEGDCEDDCTCSGYCGDYEVDEGEECDGYYGDNCVTGQCNRDDCTCVPPECGDSVVQGDEQCDGANLGECPLGPCRSNCRCPAPSCGNGTLEARESCEVSDAGFCGEHPCKDCRCDGPSECEEATALPAQLDDYEIEGSTVGAPTGTIGCGGTSGDRWYSLHVASHSLLEVRTDGVLDTEISLFAGHCAALAFVDCDDDGGQDFGSLIGPVVVKPGAYFVLVDGHGSDEGSFTLTVDLEKWPCCDADDNGTVTAGDALRVLRNAVGQPQACPLTRCDASGDSEIAASDALLTLRTAVGVVVDLYCPTTL